MTVSLTPPRRWARRLPAIDARVVAGLVLVAVSIIGGLRLAGDPVAVTRVYVAASDLDAGHVLSADDVAVREVRGDAGVLDGLSRVGHGPPIGRAVRTSIPEGSVVPVSALGGAIPAGRDITIPVTPDHALGGDVREGDRVDVLATFDKGTDAARTLMVAREATVRGVVRADGLFGQHAGAMSALTLSVEPDSAVAVAFAARNAELDVIRAHGTLDGQGRERYDRGDLR